MKIGMRCVFFATGELTPTEMTQVTTEASERSSLFLSLPDIYAFIQYYASFILLYALTLYIDFYCCDRAQEGECRKTCKRVSKKKTQLFYSNDFFEGVGTGRSDSGHTEGH